MDPMSFSARDTNLYRYVTNAPILFSDPLGLFTGLDDRDPIDLLSTGRPIIYVGGPDSSRGGKLPAHAEVAKALGGIVFNEGKPGQTLDEQLANRPSPRPGTIAIIEIHHGDNGFIVGTNADGSPIYAADPDDIADLLDGVVGDPNVVCTILVACGAATDPEGVSAIAGVACGPVIAPSQACTIITPGGRPGRPPAFVNLFDDVPWTVFFPDGAVRPGIQLGGIYGPFGPFGPLGPYLPPILPLFPPQLLPPHVL